MNNSILPYQNYNVLVDHAIKNVWCNKDQDNQRILSGQRITRKIGVVNHFFLMGRCCLLPTTTKRYHVFQIGQISPVTLGLLSKNLIWTREEWRSLKTTINSLKLFADVYVTEGIQLPRFRTFYMLSKEKNLIVAIEEDPNTPIDYMEERIYLRLYTNAWYQFFNEGDQPHIHCNGMLISNTQEILDLQTELNAYSQLPGTIYYYKNGYFVSAFNMINIAVGDTVEYIYDSATKATVDFTIKDLFTFNSILDVKLKYLLHYNSNFTLNEIEYHDDVDFYITYDDSVAGVNGLYYHRNYKDAVRMVTHKDYSLITEYVRQYSTLINQTKYSSEKDILNFKIHVRIRNSGFERPLTFNSNRIHELYKLSDVKIIQAMVGVNSCLDIWKAENLENSFYTKLMRSDYLDISKEMTEEAYGYNSCSVILGNTPKIPTFNSSVWSIELEYNQYEDSTMYEYDECGKLLFSGLHVGGTTYTCSNNNTRLVETIIGKGYYEPRVKFGIDGINLINFRNSSIRVYMCKFYMGQPDNNWIDITDSDKYRIENETLVWNNTEFNQFLMVRSDKYFLAYDFNLGLVGGNLFFTLSELEDRDGNGNYNNYQLPVPLGDLDIWLNGNSLIRGLDYIINFPTVYIVSKRFFIHPLETSEQHLRVRFYGFADKNLTMDSVEDYGFIENGFISNNNRFDIRDDKVLRITINGCLKERTGLFFSENSVGDNSSWIENGQPYQVKDIIVPMRGLTSKETYKFRDESIITDRKVSDYLSLYLPQPPRNAVSPISNYYSVVSPFFNHIIFDLKSNQYDLNLITLNMNDNDVIKFCETYEYLLDFDPISDKNKMDSKYVKIHPHILNTIITLTYIQYKFLLKVVKLYSNGKISDLSAYINFSS